MITISTQEKANIYTLTTPDGTEQILPRTVVEAVTGALPSSGGTMTGNINMGGKKITNTTHVAGPSVTINGADNTYIVTGSTANIVGYTSGDISVVDHTIRMVKDPVAPQDAANKRYIDSKIGSGTAFPVISERLMNLNTAKTRGVYSLWQYPPNGVGIPPDLPTGGAPFYGTLIVTDNGDGQFWQQLQTDKDNKIRLRYGDPNVLGEWATIGGTGDFKSDGSVPMTGPVSFEPATGKNELKNVRFIRGENGVTLDFWDAYGFRINTDFYNILELNQGQLLFAEPTKLENLADPTTPQGAATKAYVDSRPIGTGDFKADGSVPMTGMLTLPGDGLSIYTGDGGYSIKGGPSNAINMRAGEINLKNYFGGGPVPINGVMTPGYPDSAVNKEYVDIRLFNDPTYRAFDIPASHPELAGSGYLVYYPLIGLASYTITGHFKEYWGGGDNAILVVQPPPSLGSLGSNMGTVIMYQLGETPITSFVEVRDYWLRMVPLTSIYSGTNFKLNISFSTYAGQEV